MNLIKSLILSVSTYTKIPMPSIVCNDKEAGVSLVFLPGVGIIIAFAFYWLNYLCDIIGAGDVSRSAMLMIMPIIITGGIHVDGFMDTMDAKHSYASKEKKLEILSDPHIGAFSVIMLSLYGLIWLGLLNFKNLSGSPQLWLIMSLGFVYSRILCGLGICSIQPAKTTGMLSQFFKEKNTNLMILLIELGGLCGYMITHFTISTSCLYIGMGLLMLGCFQISSKKDFGGITGDLCGCFICISELVFVLASLVLSYIGL